MKKTELVTEIINLYERAERAERNCMILSDEDEIKGIELFMIAEGKKKVFENSIAIYWNHVSVHKSENGDITVTPYDEFVSKVIRSVPDYMSRREFVNYFDKELHELYEKDKEEALKLFGENHE